MVRKCHSCGETKGLKAIEAIDCDIHKNEYGNYGWHKSAICKNCFFDECACEMDGHLASECLTDESCNNHTKTIQYYNNWNGFDYHWKTKGESG